MAKKPTPVAAVQPLSIRRRWMVAAGIFLLALSARIVSNASHFFRTIDPGSRNFEICDSCYQIRRTEMIIDNYPHVPFTDTYHYYPDNPTIPWPAGYNFFLATIAKPVQMFGGSRLAQETVIGLVPCLVDAVTVMLFLFLFARYAPFGVAVLAAFLLALSNQNVGYSEVGYVDHHYFITFLTALLAWALELYERKRTAAAAVALGVLVGSITFFNVSAIQYALLTLLAVGVLAWRRRAEVPLPGNAGIVFVASVVVSFFASISTPVGRAWQWRYDQTSLFQFGLIACAALGYAALSYGRKAAFGIGALMVAAGIFLFKDFAEGARFLFVGNRLNYVQGEEVSIRGYGPIWATVFTWFAVFAPIGVWRARHWFREHPGFAAMFFLFFFHGLAAGLSHFLYVQYFFPWYALAAALGFDVVMRERARWLGVLRPLVAIIFLCQAGYVAYAEILNVNNGEREAREAIKQTIDAFAWLRENSPPTSHFERGDGPPEYSVMAHRDHGHMIVRIAHRPVVVSPFSTPDFAAHMKDYARLSLSRNEDEVVSIMRKYNSRYLVLDHRDNTMTEFLSNVLAGESDSRQFEKNANRSKMFLFRNNLLYFDGELRWRKTPSVKHFRLIYETPKLVEVPLRTKTGVTRHRYNGLKIFELTPGATVSGKGYRPGERVVFRLPLKTNSDRATAYTAYTEADDKGHIETTLAYSCDRRPMTGVEPTASSYEIERQTGGKKTLVVTEQAVETGAALTVNAF